MVEEIQQAACKRLLSAVAQRKAPVVAVIGAGLSAGAGLPDWTRLQREVIDSAVSEIGDDEGRFTRLAEAEAANPWLSFEIVMAVMGRPSFEAAIREALSVVVDKVPSVYSDLWRIPGLRGVISLNLDDLALRGYSEVYGGSKAVTHMIGAKDRVVDTSDTRRNYLWQPHGEVSRPNDWVITRTQLDSKILRSRAYAETLRHLTTGSTVIYLGISPDDLALDSALLEGVDSRVDHYWVTDRSDEPSRTWASMRGIQPILYNSEAGHGFISELLKRLREAREPEHDAPPVYSQRSGASLPGPAEAAGMGDLEQLRMSLNIRAQEILAPGDRASRQQFSSFMTEYDRAIHAAWYVPADGGNFMGYSITSADRSGAFGDLYVARDGEGNQYALKLLRPDLRRQASRLQAFRRGIRAQEILSHNHVAGMVEFVDSSEIPAFVAMEWIEGGNLEEAVSAGALADWPDIIFVLCELISIVRRAHALEEVVLHRDIRPANVMIRNLWERPDWEIVVLDFDLSTYSGAVEGTAFAPDVTAAVLGYLAPEQLSLSAGNSRSTLVDSYGFGATAYFLLTKEAPTVSMRREQFENTLAREVRLHPCADWLSVGRRVAGVVLRCTAPLQNERMHLQDALNELRACQRLLDRGRPSAKPRDVAEEILARVGLCIDRYEWKVDESLVRWESINGFLVEVRPDLAGIAVRIAWSADAHVPYGRRGAPQEFVVARMREAGLAISSSSGSAKVLDVEAYVENADDIDIDLVASKLEEILDWINRR